jgi:hypothetical protein
LGFVQWTPEIAQMYNAEAFCAKHENRILHRQIDSTGTGAWQVFDGKIANDNVDLDPSSLCCPPRNTRALPGTDWV